MIDNATLAEALNAWKGVLGDAHVSCEPGLLRDATTATFRTYSAVPAILRPANRDEVQRCVVIANRFRIPISPYSSGKNWGYGSRSPVHDAVLIDLGRLNRILDFDEELAYVTIEPGVTQAQLFDFLRVRNSKLWMDATGASPDCSIIGNTLERGFGHTPMGDHCSHVCAFEVVLPTGSCIETGFGRFKGAKFGALGRWGLGPSLDGLFSQSNFGIVTRISVWLMPAPEYFQAFFFNCKNEDQLGSIVDALRPLRLNGTLRSVIHIGNDYKVLAGNGQYPWGNTSGVPLDRETTAKISHTLNVGAWNGGGGLYGTKPQVREARSLLRRALSGKVDRLQFVDDRTLKLLGRYGKVFHLLAGWDVSRILKVLTPVYNLLKGIPTEAPLESAYWRKKSPIPTKMDPDRDGCGLFWCSPVFPCSGSHARDVTRLMKRIALEYGFEPQMSISLESERSCVCVTTISYDRSVPGEDEQASRCYEALTEALMAKGYPPYRLNVASMGYSATDSEYATVLESLKLALDPNGILSPGRYVQRSTGVANKVQASSLVDSTK